MAGESAEGTLPAESHAGAEPMPPDVATTSTHCTAGSPSSAFVCCALNRPSEGIAGAVGLSIFLGGGAIAAEELEYADTLGVPWVYIPCK
jgi:hypothetical protein